MNVDNQNEFMSINEVFSVLKKEIQLTDGPQAIPTNFYQNIANVISKLKSNAIEIEEDDKEKNIKINEEKISGQIKNNLLNLYLKAVTLLFVYRCRKIFSVNKKTNETFEYSNLTEEEKYVFYGNRDLENRINIVINTIFEGKPKTLEKIVSSINEYCLIVRFLDTMEQFVGINMNKYGPFKKEDIAILPFENARSIIENNKAIEILMVN